ncbi:MAG: Asp-tRNA(Asn)/Glu-tRNA(Gln) amidotransferase subunit GatB [Acidimicrobiia bacterium]|nr:Asp-tRNA(Asn)/Glu-tRNA(Gln) amidotransferase subunit GatB [Acidimicrobiia bacterium]MYD03593.1 Asp-tRNA(Asn)/Glu-tRNA(Gln) amidotransferase subunit GatB [Acidimicrobiia bacterium]
MSWEAVIGLETHVELSTESKMFCGCPARFESEPNTNVCPVCLGLPGALPVPNREAINRIMRIGLALNCSITRQPVFHRKNYFYADLPKNYQISQFDLPVCVDGFLEVGGTDPGRVGIERVHQEEDTGKSTHMGGDGRISGAEYSLLDFNRSGVPLVEIVTRPDLRSAAQARAYGQELKLLVEALGVSDARLEEGSIRFDANVSVRSGPEAPLGTKVEIKNMNSFRSLERAVTYEIGRQTHLLSQEGTVVMETRHWDEEAGATRGGRVKEGSSDYRYFPDPDLVPMEIDPAWESHIRASLPELPAARRTRYEQMGVDPTMAATLVAGESGLAGLFEEAVNLGAGPSQAANWVTGEVVAALRKASINSVTETGLTGSALAELLEMIGQGKLSGSAAREVLTGVIAGEGGSGQVAAARDLIQISDTEMLAEVIEEVLAAHPDEFSRLQGGEQKLVGFLVGQVMRRTRGKADPKLAGALIAERSSAR